MSDWAVSIRAVAQMTLPDGRRMAYELTGAAWLFARGWGVDLADMAVPAHIWHGTEDRNVPVAHARVIGALCPGARLHIVEGGGHLLLGQIDQIIDSLSPAA
jgi:pimeloyl-ACP methyl ester carboxylesterase